MGSILLLVFKLNRRCAAFSAGARDPAEATFKKTACGCCGRIQMGWYDRKVCRVRDLSCGDTRVFLQLEVRRLDCRGWARRFFENWRASLKWQRLKPYDNKDPSHPAPRLRLAQRGVSAAKILTCMLPAL